MNLKLISQALAAAGLLAASTGHAWVVARPRVGVGVGVGVAAGRGAGAAVASWFGRQPWW